MHCMVHTLSKKMYNFVLQCLPNFNPLGENSNECTDKIEQCYIYSSLSIVLYTLGPLTVIQ